MKLIKPITALSVILLLMSGELQGVEAEQLQAGATYDDEEYVN